jgi:hypothetical protein
MIACGPHHHGAPAAAVQKTGPVHAGSARLAQTKAGDDHAKHGHGTGHHGDVATVEDYLATPSGAETLTDYQQGAEPKKASSSKCSVCATCCTAAVLPSSTISIDSPPLADRVHSVFTMHAAVFMTDGPDRPPRILLD